MMNLIIGVLLLFNSSTSLLAGFDELQMSNNSDLGNLLDELQADETTGYEQPLEASYFLDSNDEPPVPNDCDSCNLPEGLVLDEHTLRQMHTFFYPIAKDYYCAAQEEWEKYKLSSEAEDRLRLGQRIRGLLRRASEMQHSQAQLGYSWVLKKGIGNPNHVVTEVDCFLSRYYLKRSAKKHYVYAQYSYALLLWEEKKFIKACSFMKLAAQQGLTRAMNNYYVYLNDLKHDLEFTASDLMEATEWLKIAADSGLSNAQYNYGRKLLLAEDPCLAKFYFEKAAEQNLPEAIEYLRIQKF